MKNKFYVIIGDFNHNSFTHYDILPYLSNSWKKLSKKKREEITDLKEWVKDRLRYQYWSRTEYEILLLSWPPIDNEDPRKIDIFWQCEPNLDIITKLFKENEKIN